LRVDDAGLSEDRRDGNEKQAADCQR
jgi:hypothetical protein